MNNAPSEEARKYALQLLRSQFVEMGRIGGEVRSERKRRAVLENLKKANAARKAAAQARRFERIPGSLLGLLDRLR